MADPSAHEWDELRKIDYFLEHLARAVERGEVPRESYDRLAPRYLERRGEIAAIIERRAVRAPLAAPTVFDATAAPAPSPAPPVPITTQPAPAGSAPLPVAAQPAAVPVAPSVARTPRPEPKPVPWTTILTITGAFLVIVAAAIFAVATWDLFGVGFKLAFLGTLTVGFYVAGDLVRRKLRLLAGSVALFVVGSAMLLFDGWIAIDGFGLQGAWPWVAWLAVCSLVYWYSEVAIGGSFFGIIGASAQVAWVWLLGEGLAWPTPQRLAAVAFVAVLWALAARNAAGRSGFTSLATVLRYAAPVAVAGCALGALGDLSAAPADWGVLLSALVIGTCATVVFEAGGIHPGVAAAAHIPVFFAFASMTQATGTTWWHLALLAAMIVAYLLHELLRGGWGHGVLALAAEFAATLVLADRLGAATDVTLVMVGLVATSWIAAALVIERSGMRAARYPGAVGMRIVAEAGGWIALAGSTLLIPMAREVVPLAAVPLAARDAALPAAFLGLWLLAGRILRRPPAALVALVLSLYSAAALMAWAAPELESSLYASGLIAVLAVWFLGRRGVQAWWGMPGEVVEVSVRVISGAVLVLGLAAQVYFFDFDVWQTSVLFFAIALLWTLDAFLAEERRGGLAIASSAVVFAAAILADAMLADRATSWVGPAVAVLLVLVAAPSRCVRGMSMYWVWGAGSAALVLCAVAPGSGPGSVALCLGLTAVAWVGAAVIGAVPGLVLLASVLGFGALFALTDHLDLASWARVAAGVVASYALLGALALPVREGAARRWADVVGAAGFIGMVITCTAVAAGHLGESFVEPSLWGVYSGHELAAAVGFLGVFVIVAGILRDIDEAPYLGVAALLLAYCIELATLDIGTVEWFTTPLALYIVWAGWWSRRGRPGRGSAVPDVMAAIVGLGIPSLLAANPLYQDRPWVHLVWAVALALVAIGAGVALRVRGYFFGGIAALVFTAIVRTWVYLVSFWWLVLGIIGIAMLVVALTWERQQQLVATARRAAHAALTDWR